MLERRVEQFQASSSALQIKIEGVLEMAFVRLIL
jgi:hypothetical protein